MGTTIDTITVELSVVLGTSEMPIHQLLRMGRGAVIELDTTEDDDVQVLANNIPVARGQVILRGEKIGVSVTKVLMRPPDARPRDTVHKVVGDDLPKRDA
ncbi:flagellar motor switch protein FliN/FliY [Rhodobium orientis]|uniref:Flagellar motor switch protein FliN n=1 Tax=Rhodobium orientis TaxID=34017 RepID=A0A327JET5_9HYPH|nr:FliM/FliN family flagellar motor switch protein [Rhodobium orientis]MBB4301561.1 flagellar motor switch protein FliN/FliY [Rhodobium orientis]MBK5952257.1 flagellar motor switch protein FliN [Rhodobium orientis]RAI24947.1 flagellar motor switch protein FliN [Rhodobium orientis]